MGAPGSSTERDGMNTGPLTGVRVVEIASLAPAPFGCMIRADLGAEVLRIDRASASARPAQDPNDGPCLTPPARDVMRAAACAW